MGNEPEWWRSGPARQRQKSGIRMRCREGKVICTHHPCWLSRTGNGLLHPECHRQEAARRSVPSCPAQQAAAAPPAPSTVWLFWVHIPAAGAAAGSAPRPGNEMPKRTAHIEPCNTSGLTNLPGLTTQALGSSQLCRAPSSRLNQNPSCARCSLTAPSTSPTHEAATCSKNLWC